ncbi:MAG: RNA polymerase sigma factor [Clostridia bacterium]|nr:RNA polymerase sigma factor [Clostridia bacterium]
MDKVQESESIMDKELFIELINQNRLKLYKTAISILKNDDDANDAIQETLLSSYKNYQNLKDKKLFTTWIIRILINKCYDIINKKKKIVYIEDSTIENTTSYYDKYQTDSILENVLNKIDDELREITLLYYYDDLSTAAISEILNIPPGTVKSRLSRARSKILEIIKKEEGEENDG